MPQGYDRVTIYKSASSESATPPLSKDADEITAADFNSFQDSLKKTNFRLIESFLSGRWIGESKFERDPDNNDELKEFGATELNALQASTDQYLVELNWKSGSEEKITVEKKEIKFDTVKFIFGKADGLSIVKVYAYKFADFLGSDPEAEFSVAYQINVYANTTNLYNTVEDIVSKK